MAILFSDLQQRFLDLVGQPDGAVDDFGKRNINRAIGDVVNKYPFSWNVKSTTITLSNGTANLPADFNPRHGLRDARISANGVIDIFDQVTIEDRDSFTESDYVYWITYDTTNHVHVFNSVTQTGTVTIYYNFMPTDLSADGDYCIVPDLEAVAYLAASKNWIGAERDVDLKREYEQEADKYITALWVADCQYGPELVVNSLSVQLG